MEMGFQVGGNVSFGFHVGGGSAPQPPEPSDHKCALTGAALPKFEAQGLLRIPPVVGLAERRIITVSGGGRSVNVDTIAEARTLLESGDGYDTVDIAEDSGITSIASNAFYSETPLPLKSISMPGVRAINDSAFRNCTRLEEVVLSPYLSTLGGSIFSGCTRLETIDLSMCKLITSVSAGMFYGCTSLKNVSLPENGQLGAIGGGSFRDCTSLETIGIPDTVWTINDSAFRGCSNLEEVDLSTGLEQMGENVFSDCVRLGHHTEQEGYIFRLPEGCRIVGGWSFTNCTRLNKFYIPSTMQSFGFEDSLSGGFYTMFGGCTSLTSIRVYKNRGELNGYSDCWDAPNEECRVIWNDSE